MVILGLSMCHSTLPMPLRSRHTASRHSRGLVFDLADLAAAYAHHARVTMHATAAMT